MIVTRLTQRILLAVACCFALIVVPATAGAQIGSAIEKGAHGVKKGVETGVEKTKEGTEAVGKGVKNAVTGDDTEKNNNRMKSTPSGASTEGTSPTSSSSSTTKSKSSRESTKTSRGETGKKLPATAGELPLLALVGGLALAASGTSRLLRRVK